ncbi:hypothetical protein NE237_029784 [Protea cynaroides]|uniref:Uncharacterized protein n=1 Tax=Protea cynaroides TaxID=273540 RepID=A0A9Q0JVF5_9MAGN|nr:hypothetical protein NE237_029784 [Protea cynaroides]
MVQEDIATVDRQNGGVQSSVSFLAFNPHLATINLPQPQSLIQTHSQPLPNNPFRFQPNQILVVAVVLMGGNCGDDGSDWNKEETASKSMEDGNWNDNDDEKEAGSESLEDGDWKEEEKEEEASSEPLEDGDEDKGGSESAKALDIEATCNKITHILKG